MRALSLLLATLLAVAAVPAAATSYLPISDADLASQAPVIVQATVVASEPAPIAEPPSTDHFVQIERLIKGYVAGSTVVVRVLGGVGPDGIGLRVWGAPRFRAGARVLLFLTPREDGTYAVLHMMLGAFHEVESGGRRLAVRDLGEAVEIAGVDPRPERDFERFVEWLADRAGEVRRSADYFVAAGPVLGPGEGLDDRLLEDDCTGLNFRWFDFDRGGRAVWRFDRAGFDGRGGGKREFAQARTAWRHAAGTPIRLVMTGETGPRTGLRSMDGVNTLLFNDPDDRIAGRFECSRGGLLAVAGVWFQNGRNQQCQAVSIGRKGWFNGEAFLKILSADVVTNDGSACFFRDSPSGGAELLGHELGHTLGLAHSQHVEALMRGRLHDDGRGARLHSADEAVISKLYGRARFPRR